MKEVIVEQRAFGMEHPWKRVASMDQFDRKFTVGAWNSCTELRLRLPGYVWSTNYKKTRQLVEEFLNNAN